MQLSSHKSGVSVRWETFAFLRYSLGAVLFVFVATLAPRLASGTPLGRSASSGPGLPFAAADFDGDHLPDIATVQDGRSDHKATDYWVRLKLSNSGQRYIRVAAPRGGLSVEARDVNGDNAIDLVFATAWLGQPVAVLINDGHGNFSRTSPSDFPGAFVQANAAWNEGADQPSDISAISGKSPASEFEIQILHAAIQLQNDASGIPSIDLFLGPSVPTHAGRAPPTSVLL